MSVKLYSNVLEINEDSSLIYLTNVTYFESKHEVLVEFSSNKKKLIKRFRFFPFVFLPSSLDKNKLVELFLESGFKGFNIEECGDKLVLKTFYFSDLKKICNLIAILLNKMPVIIEPARAFLVEKNWSFFDAFEEIDGVLFKVDRDKDFFEVLKNIDLSFFLTKGVSFNDAFNLNQDKVLYLIEFAAWSNILSIPLNSIPSKLSDKLELFLENIFFRDAELICFEPIDEVFLDSGFEPLSRKDNLSKLDFSSIWFELFSKNFFNMGKNCLNCSCCSPITLESNNLLPSSLIRVQILEDNFFFESSSSSFAFKFHKQMPFKELRVNKKKEFFLNSFPVGPFFKEDFALIPLNDAKKLIDLGSVRLVSSKSVEKSVFIKKGFFFEDSLHDLNWFCKNKESIFSKEVSKINSKIFLLNKFLDINQNHFFPQNKFGLLYSKSLRDSFKLVFLNVPFHLTNSSSKFYSNSFARVIVSVQESTLSKFLDFSKNKGYRVIHANKSNVFVKGFSSLRLVKSFAVENSLPQPQIAGFASIRNKEFF